MPPHTVGVAMAILGVLGITLQLTLYAPLTYRFGTITSWRYALILFPFAYIFAPYLAVVPSSTAPPLPASGFLVWLALTVVLAVQVTARTFALPATIILVNNASPHPSVLGTLHGIAQSTSCAARTLGPVVGGWAFGKGLEGGVVGGVWWGLAVVAMTGWGESWWVREGSGREILLEGEKEEEEESREEGRR